MVLQKYNTTIILADYLNNRVKLFRLLFPEQTQFSFIAGQFVIVNVIDSEGKKQRRSYSIASLPSNSDFIELCVKILPDGKVSKILDSYALGTNLEIDGPYGKFIVNKNENKELIFIGTGVGISPLRSMLYDVLTGGYAQPVWLFYGFRYKEDFLFREEFGKLEEQYSNFHFVPVISRPNENADIDFDIGHVTDIIPKYIKNTHLKTVFVCGSMAAVRDIVSCLEKMGFAKEQIKTEAWESG